MTDGPTNLPATPRGKGRPATGRGAGSKPSSARDLALAVLADRAGNFTARLARLLAEGSVAPTDAALARELVFGVVRRQRTLDAVIAAFSQQPYARLPGRVRSILRLGAYQLLFLQRVPDFAAVNEAVNQAARSSAHLRGFVNGLLRNVARAALPVVEGVPPPAPDVLALGPSVWRRLDRPVLPDAAGQPAAYLAAAYSLPDELAGKWLTDLGGLARAVAIAQHADARPPLTLRVNLLRTTVPEVLQRLRAAGVLAVAHANGSSIVVAGGDDLTKLDVFAAGLVQPQDAMATAVVAECPVQPGMRVLDLCAAPGGKTTHLAERMENRGQIIAADVSPEKLARIEDNARRMRLDIIQPVLADRLATVAEPPFDLVLVDAPCSNTGVLARRAEARWRFSLANLRQLAREQCGLLLLGAQLARPGGACVYATCSLEKEENQDVVRGVLARRPELRLLRERTILPTGADDPTQWSDGGYVAILRRG